jgi:hypothetical protein
VKEVRDRVPWMAKLVRRANIILFSLNVAWMTTLYVLLHTNISLGVGEVFTVFHWRFWMPEPGWVVGQVVYSLLLCIPFSLFFFLLARLSRAGRYLPAIAGTVAIAALPFYALHVGGSAFSLRDENLALAFPSPVFLVLALEALAVLVCALVCYVRRWRVPIALSTLVLLLHFGLWAWASGNYASPLSLLRQFRPYITLSPLQKALRVCIMMLYHNGFPAIGFLSCLASVVDLKLSPCYTPSSGVAGAE